MRSLDLSVILVSYNTRDLTLECLRSVFQQTAGIESEVIVVDNASADGSTEAITAAYPKAKIIPLAENVGFARGSNLGAVHSRGRYLLFLNPDTVVLDGAIRNLLAFADAHPRAGLYGGRSLDLDGVVNADCCLGFPTLWSTFCAVFGFSTLFRRNRLYDPESLGSWPRDSVRTVDVITGCFLMVCADVWRALGGFDPRFFMYCEETDLCLRAKQAGYRPLFTPDAQVIHRGAASHKNRADYLVRMLHGRVLFFRKHSRPMAAQVICMLLELGTLNRLMASAVTACIARRGQERYRVWSEVWMRRREWRGCRS